MLSENVCTHEMEMNMLHVSLALCPRLLLLQPHVPPSLDNKPRCNYLVQGSFMMIYSIPWGFAVTDGTHAQPFSLDLTFTAHAIHIGMGYAESEMNTL